MDDIKTIVAENLKVLIQQSGDSITQFARRAGVAPNTLSTFLVTPTERNLTLDKLEALAAEGGVMPWVLMVPKMDMTYPPRATIKSITDSGYLLLNLIEKSPKTLRYSILDHAAYTVEKTLPKECALIRENLETYLSE